MENGNANGNISCEKSELSADPLSTAIIKKGKRYVN